MVHFASFPRWRLQDGGLPGSASEDWKSIRIAPQKQDDIHPIFAQLSQFCSDIEARSSVTGLGGELLLSEIVNRKVSKSGWLIIIVIAPSIRCLSVFWYRDKIFQKILYLFSGIHGIYVEKHWILKTIKFMMADLGYCNPKFFFWAAVANEVLKQVAWAEIWHGHSLSPIPYVTSSKITKLFEVVNLMFTVLYASWCTNASWN